MATTPQNAELVESIKLPISLFHYERLTWLDRTDFDDVKQKVAQDMKEVTTEFLAGGIVNLKRYYCLSIVDPLNFHAVPRPLDPFWHSHMLFSREYMPFCQKIIGQYIHHQPLLENDRTMVEAATALYRYTYSIQSKIFKEVDPSWWPEPGAHHPICYHMESVDPILREKALLPGVKQLLKQPRRGHKH